MIKGLDELVKSLKGLDKQFSHADFQKANVKAAEPVITKAHRIAPVGLTGDYADSIGLVKLGKKSTQLGGVNVGPRRGGGFEGFHGHLIEFGTKQRRTKTTGANRGVMPKNPVMTRSWEATKNEALGIVTKELQKKAEKYLKDTVPK